ncbi:restriction endonuclease, SacI family [Poseidonibacter sp.]|uniref:restriction endonuclease, SacI family n=1 Tax=Poseidonibacter sp. TaxID=2321188 RepID=UPI003C748287
MNYSELLESIYKEANKNINYSEELTQEILNNITTISEKCFNQKGVFTVLVTLSIYKIKHSKQDIRIHQNQLKNGFSGRSIDTRYITPILKKIGLPSMAESGWLTRSLEQPFPYTLDYNGKINDKNVKNAFLKLVNEIQINKINPKFILVELFKQVIKIQKENKIENKPLENPDKLTISKIINLLDKQFSFNYKTFGGSKLPVLAFYSIYKIIINEISRYNNCILKELGSHTASDRTSKSAGDIEIFNNGELFEAIEIKLDKPIDTNILRIAKEKIIRYNPKRYYILSYYEIKQEDVEEINKIIQEVKEEHGCQIIVNGIMATLKYYMRLISDLEVFYNSYSELINIDEELKATHKQKWNELTEELNHEL